MRIISERLNNARGVWENVPPYAIQKLLKDLRKVVEDKLSTHP